MSTENPTEPSICIPRVFANIPWRFVKEKFEEDFKYGEVDRVDMVLKENDKGEKYKRVFVHFKKWNDVVDRDRILSGEEVQVVYNDPWFWKITKSRIDKPERNALVKPPPAPRRKINITSSRKTTKTTSHRISRRDRSRSPSLTRTSRRHRSRSPSPTDRIIRSQERKINRQADTIDRLNEKNSYLERKTRKLQTEIEELQACIYRLKTKHQDKDQDQDKDQEQDQKTYRPKSPDYSPSITD